MDLYKIYKKRYGPEFRKIRQSIEYPCKCKICERNFMKICVHHIDGDPANNERDNILFVCEDCHTIIHHWFGKNNTKTKYSYCSSVFGFHKFCIMIDKLRDYREKWLHKDNKFERPIDKGMKL